jgi:hypothetical protein
MSSRSTTPLDFTIYRQVVRRIGTVTEYRDAPTGVPLPEAVRNAIFEEAPQWIHIYDGPYGSTQPAYVTRQLPDQAFYVAYGDTYWVPHVGRGTVMVFDTAGRKLYQGPDFGE